MKYEMMRVPVDWDDDDDRRAFLLTMERQRWEPVGGDANSVYLRRSYHPPMSGRERLMRSALFPLLLIAICVYIGSRFFA